MARTNIALVGGFASTNIGNDFFTRSIQHVLSGISPDFNIIVTQNLPGYFWKEGNGNPANSFNYIQHLDIDYLVLTGPLFDRNFPVLWRDTLSVLKKKGTRIVFFSAGSQKYDADEHRIVGDFLKTVEPHGIVTRDTPTYEAYGDLARHSYDGIDFAFFLNDLFKPYPLDLEKYVILNFDTGPEPRFGAASEYDQPFTFLGEQWSYRQRTHGRVMKILTRKFPGMEGFYNKRFGDYTIIRPVNFINPATSGRLFRAPNTYVSELATDYLNLFANAQGVLSSRVHSCIASLVFGKEVMLFSKTRRGKLFDRVGLTGIRERPVSLDLNYLEEEKERMREFLQGLFR